MTQRQEAEVSFELRVRRLVAELPCKLKNGDTRLDLFRVLRNQGVSPVSADGSPTHAAPSFLHLVWT